jgi:hypothetical protein
MKTSVLFILSALVLHSFGFQGATDLNGQDTGIVQGIVFHDISGSGSYDPVHDKPLEGIAVSNGREVTVTDRDGQYQLPLRDNSAIFVIKPRNWSVPVDNRQLHRFYYIHSTGGASGNGFRGLPPTGSLTAPVNFSLYPSDEPDSFNVLVFGDTQPRNEQEIYYLSEDAISELSGVDAAFGVTLGDVVFDDLDLFDHLTGSIATVGLPWRYVLGNHDIDFSGNTDHDARGAWYRTFGPSYYSFSYGAAHFIVLDNIRWIVESDRRYYRTGLGEDQMEFLRNELGRMDRDQLVVLLVHIPWAGSTEWQCESERQELYELLAGHPNSVSLVAHTHRHYHHLIGSEEGFPGDVPHHMVSVGTVCGAWWTGAPDEYGIPHSMMSDGTPTSYTFLHIDVNDWKMGWRASRRPAGFQMHIVAPEVVESQQPASVTVRANIFNALPSAEVKMRIGEGEWLRMVRTPEYDPVRMAVADREKELGEVPWRNLGESRISEHIWVAETEVLLDPGVYPIEIRAADDWWEYEGRRLLHVK